MRLSRLIVSTVLAASLVVGASAQPTSVPPPTATPPGGVPDAPAVDVTTVPQIDASPTVLRLDPSLLRVVLYVQDGPQTTALIAPADNAVQEFIPDPNAPSKWVGVDSFGTFSLHLRQDVSGLPAPFTPFAPADRASNDKLVVDAAWSPDGTTLAIVLDNPDRAAAEDGVYWWEIGVTGANQIMHNCRPGVPNCIHYVSSDGNPGNWYGRSASWSPDGETLLVRAYMDGYGYDGFMLLNRGSNRTQRPPFCPYQYSEWTPDGSGIVVSGLDNNALPTLGVVAADDCDNFSPAAIWGTAWVTRDGVMRPDGSLVTLARVGGDKGAYRIIDGDGNTLSGDIGVTTPVEVHWNKAASVVYVRTEDNRAYVATIEGAISEITDAVAGANAVAWVDVPRN